MSWGQGWPDSPAISSPAHPGFPTTDTVNILDVDSADADEVHLSESAFLSLLHFKRIDTNLSLEST